MFPDGAARDPSAHGAIPAQQVTAADLRKLPVFEDVSDLFVQTLLTSSSSRRGRSSGGAQAKQQLPLDPQ